ncbi:hypothetical protein sos41_35680 [Alphaproteobacteria bacterium SO-S41]|nr:hypothetical protein sos41_35680 [Alphaproteobacteria bacterium SO-S41]
MNRAFRIGGLAVLALALAGGALVLFAPVDRLREPIEIAVREATGRSFHIHGPVRLTFASGIGLDLGAVTLADVPGAASATMATASNAVLQVAFLPLLSGSVEPIALTLDGADIHLTRDETGRANWAFPQAGKAGDPFDALGFGDVRLINSRIVIDAGEEGSGRELNFVDARLRWPSGAPTLSLSGTIAFRSERFEVDGLIETPHALFQGGVVPLRVAFSSGLAEGSLDGDADLAADSFEGGVNLSAPSARRLASFFGALIPGERGFGEMSLAAAIVATHGEAHLRNIKFTLDDMTGGGDLGIKLTGARLSFAGALSVDSFDLATYLSAPPASGGVGWSDAPLDLSGLRDIDANLALRVSSAALAGLKASNVTGTLALGDGTLTADIATATLYGGLGRARLAIDLASFAPGYQLALTLTNFDAQSFFADAVGSAALMGQASLTLDLKGEGTTRREVVAGLDGKLQLELANGALDGVDLTAIARSVGMPGALNGATADDATTLTTLSAAFTVADGMARTTALKLTTHAMTLAARGTIGLAARALRLRFAPAGAGVPFSVTGPWAAPTYLADWAGLTEEGLAGVAETRRPWLYVLLKVGAVWPEPPLVAGVTEAG